MKSFLTITGAIVLLTVFLFPVVHAQKTSAGYDKGADFSTYKTFAFDKSGARNPFVNALIVAAVERELISRGLRR